MITSSLFFRYALICFIFGWIIRVGVGEEWWKPYNAPCTERQNVFEFTEKPKVRKVAEDKYEITFAVKGYCDVTVAIIDPDPKKELVPGRGIVVRHLGAGVLGPNAPVPFQKNSLKQTIYWDGKDDLDVYCREPEKLKVRVMLGLNPVFDKRLGGTSPYNIPGRICGIAVSPEGGFVFSTAHRQRLYIRHFDRDGNYVRSLVPPPANLPEEKLAGMTYVEYEPGKRAVHSAQAQGVYQTVSDHGRYLADSGKGRVDMQPAIAGNRIYYVNGGEYAPSTLYYVYTDGSTDVPGTRGRLFSRTRKPHMKARLAASPDGKWLYMSGDGSGARECVPHVLRCYLENEEPTVVFCGETTKPGADNQHLNGPTGIDCDAEGRVYVCDSLNNRIQIFDSNGKYLKTIPVDRPLYVCVHKKTGAIYVQHAARVSGKTIRRITKFESFNNPVARIHFDGPFGLMALDSWSSRPRLWFANGETSTSMATVIDTTAQGGGVIFVVMLLKFGKNRGINLSN